jgi:predicted GIY-YIG superfamily endonuclease
MNCNVYKLTSPSGKYYVGVTKNIHQRISSHYNKSNNLLVREEVEKYGYDVSWEIIASNIERKIALEIEQKEILKDKNMCMNSQASSVYVSSQIGFNICQDLKTDVKMKCAREGKTIREVVELLLKEWVQK